jgi:hypothetical protein
MRTASALLTLVLLPALPGVGWVCSQEGGEVFAPKNGMYTITIPPGEKAQQTRVLTFDKHKVPVEAMRSVQKDGTTYTGGSIGIPAVVMRNIPADKRFDILRDAIVKEMKGKVLEEKDVLIDPVPGKEYLIQLPKGVTRLRIFTVAGWVVTAEVEGKTKDDVNAKQADEFFATLQFTDQAKDVYRRVKR